MIFEGLCVVFCRISTDQINTNSNFLVCSDRLRALFPKVAKYFGFVAPMRMPDVAEQTKNKGTTSFLFHFIFIVF